MNYAYLRVSTTKQDLENQRHEILKMADKEKFLIDNWVEETVSSRVKLEKRKLSALLCDLKKGDVLICSELSRLGRNTGETMAILHQLKEKEVKVSTAKEYIINEFIDNPALQNLLTAIFAFFNELERERISLRTKISLDALKEKGIKLGRPKGSLGKSKLDDKRDEIQDLYNKDIPMTVIAKLIGVHYQTIRSYIKTRGITKEKK